ncbi:hypothetical protein BpHYR1_005067 [Brachionus plicatilis]|uniref:Uncharacterized protein n=1 Tax=Brachionus plicatilis TaxID=10195 RepID=A0A3M7T6F3_BRAPC|nr:hypothetical protein BpHYR1_005067 [Brachionus plicatilis]
MQHFVFSLSFSFYNYIREWVQDMQRANGVTTRIQTKRRVAKASIDQLKRALAHKGLFPPGSNTSIGPNRPSGPPSGKKNYVTLNMQANNIKFAIISRLSLYVLF